MNKQEKELMDEKFKGIIALITAQEDNRKVRDDAHMAIILETRDLARITNGRVTKLELKEATHYVDCPNNKRVEQFEQLSTFWFWFSKKPIRLALFFAIPILAMYIFSIEGIWSIVEKLIKLF